MYIIISQNNNQNMKTIKVGSDFSGVGAFNQALKRLGINYEEIFACDMDRYARKTFIHNYGMPKYYPGNVYEREIPVESLDIYMTSPPCQAFSLAGKRLGKDDHRGILFFNSYEFIKKNNPRYFIFENVKGLLSDDNGKTFSEWINLLAGKSVNGNAVMFPYDDSLPYHVYYKVLNAKDYGIPQNRERIFIIGIRDDQDNEFRFPKEEFLNKKLKDILEYEVDEKYFLSKKMLSYLETNSENQQKNGNGFKFTPTYGDKIGKAVTCKAGNRMDDEFIKIKSATSKGYEEATIGDSINLSQPNSETRRERVGKQIAQTLDTGCNQGILSYTRNNKGKIVNRHINQYSNTIHSATGGSGNTDQLYLNNYRIRRLTPKECFRLMDFPDDFDFSVVSDSQAYKQAGNSIVICVLAKIIKNLKL